MNNKILGNFALLGAPAMFLGVWAESSYPQLSASWFTGVWGVLYITAWLCSIIILRRSGALGTGPLARAMPLVLFCTLTIANISNLFWFVSATARPSFFMALDLCWPLSHVLMIVVAVLVLRAKKVGGWRRFAPLAMATWLPLALGSLALLGRTPAVLFGGGLYNAIVVTALALAVRSLPEAQAPQPSVEQGFRPVLQ